MKNESKNKNIADELLNILTLFPKNLMQNYSLENLSEFVLHDLCSNKFFAIDKAAYFVNNKDFNFFKGVAGFENKHIYSGKNKWENHSDFTAHMRKSEFNNKVRDYNNKAFNSENEYSRIMEISDKLLIVEPKYYKWNIKHDNLGLLVYSEDRNNKNVNFETDHLFNFLHLLGFCQIF